MKSIISLLLDQSGHQRPVLNGITIILAMLVATAMVGVLYLGQLGGLSGSDDRTLDERFPRVPDDWPYQESDRVRFSYPPHTTVQQPSDHQRRQIRQRAQQQNWSVLDGWTLRTRDGDTPIAHVIVGVLSITVSRSNFLEQRIGGGGSQDSEHLSGTLKGRPTVLITQPTESEFPRVLEGWIVPSTRTVYHVSIDSGTKYRGGSQTLARIINSLEVP